MTVCGQEFSPQVLQRLQQTVEAEPGLSRRALSRRVCEWLNWRTALGQLKEVSCRVALRKLEQGGKIHLPAVCPAVVSTDGSSPARSAARLPGRDLAGGLAAGELGTN